MPLPVNGGRSLRRPPRRSLSADASTDWSQEAEILSITPASPDRPIRADWPRSVIGEIAHERLPNLAPVATEGPNEALAVRQAWALLRPTAIIAQPETAVIAIGPRVIHHHPDFLIRWPGGEMRLEVKGSTGLALKPWVAPRLAAIARAYAVRGLDYRVATAAALRAEPLASNVRSVWLARGRAVPDASRDYLLDPIAAGARTVGSLVAAAMGDAGFCDGASSVPIEPCAVDLAIRELARLHADGEITLALVGGPLGLTTTVRPGAMPQEPPGWYRADRHVGADGCGS